MIEVICYEKSHCTWIKEKLDGFTRTHDCLFHFCQPEDLPSRLRCDFPIIHGVLADATEHRDAVIIMLKQLKQDFPRLPIAVFTVRSPDPADSEAAFPYADHQQVFPCSAHSLEAFLAKLIPTVPIMPGGLFVSQPLQLLGYPLQLTHMEKRLLFLLACYPNHVIPSEQIAALLSIDVASLPVLVYRINRKALAVSARKLILQKRRYGYFFNSDL